MSAADLFASTVPGVRNVQPSQIASWHNRTIGDWCYRIDQDYLVVYNRKVWAVLEEKRGNERCNRLQWSIVARSADDMQVPAFLVRSRHERLQWEWCGMNDRGREWLASVPELASVRIERAADGLQVKRIACNESGYIRLHGLLRGVDDAEVAEAVRQIQSERLLQVPGDQLVRYEREAFMQRPGAYPDPVAAWEESERMHECQAAPRKAAPRRNAPPRTVARRMAPVWPWQIEYERAQESLRRMLTVPQIECPSTILQQSAQRAIDDARESFQRMLTVPRIEPVTHTIGWAAETPSEPLQA